MKNSLLTIVFILITAFSCKNNDADANFLADEDMIMDTDLMAVSKTHMLTMDNVKMNGDFDYDFANLMIIHHQMAIDMSKVQLENGSNQSIISIAKGIIEAQEIEIRVMQQVLKSYKIPVTNNQTSNSFKLAKEMKSMMETMESLQMTSNSDKDYVTMMMPHHESAVKMAKMQLEFGNQAGLIELAKNIVEDQNYEIAEFKQWLAKN